MAELTCEKHNRILIGKDFCVDCQKERQGMTLKNRINNLHQHPRSTDRYGLETDWYDSELLKLIREWAIDNIGCCLSCQDEYNPNNWCDMHMYNLQTRDKIEMSLE